MGLLGPEYVSGESTRRGDTGPCRPRGRRHLRCHRGDGPSSSNSAPRTRTNARAATPLLLCGVPGGPPRPRQPVGPPSFAASRGVTSPRPARPCRRTPSGRLVVASTPLRCEGPRAPRSRRGWCGPARGHAARPTPHGAPARRARARRLRMPAARGRCWSPKGQGRSPASGNGACVPRSGPTYERDIGLGVQGTGPAGCSSRVERLALGPGRVKTGPGASEPPPRRRVSATRSPGR